MANFFVKAECDPNGSDTTAVVCGSFTWYGEVYNGSTTAFHTLTNQGGCDSIITLFLTIIPSTNFSIVNNGSPCLNSVLSVTGGDLSELNNISWLLNGDTITNVPPAVTVARTFTPWGLSVDNNRNVYVADASDGRVQKWAPGATAGVTVAGGNGNYSSGPADLSGPRGIFKDADDTLYVVDGYNNRIQKWAPGATEGVTVAGGNGGGSNLNQFDQPQDVYVDLDRNVYVTEYNNSRVVKWAPGATEGVIVAGGNGYGPNLNQIARPVGIWLDNNLNIYVSDFQYHRIVKWAPNATVGVVVAGITNEPGSDEFHLNQPYDVYGDRDGNIYVADLNNQRIQKFSSNSTGGDAGITVAGGNGEGPNNDQFWNTLSVHVDSIGNIYVSDQINQRVQKWFKQGLPDTYVPTALGNYSVAYTNIYGCTGTSNEIAVSIPTDSIATVSACGSYEWIDGNTYTYSTNDPSFNAGPNAAGCDSTIYLHLTIYPIASDTFVYTCGDSFTWYGVTYNATPTVKPTKIFINEFGCDSTVTLNLTIFPRADYTLSNLGTDCLNDAQLQINGAGLEDINKIEWLLDGQKESGSPKLEARRDAVLRHPRRIPR